MSALHATWFLLAIAALALAVVSIANRIHQRQQAVRYRSSVLRRRITELEEMALTVEPVVESLAIAKLINDENLRITQTALELEPNSEALAAHRSRAEALAEDFGDDQRPRQLNRLLDSDSAIARARYYISEAARVLRQMESRGALEPHELELFISELAWAHLMVQVISMVGQGHKSLTRGNHLSAFAYYRKAQQALLDTIHSDVRRHAMIRQLGEILSGTRSALSLDLMPESDYNPGAATPLQESEIPEERHFA